MLHSICLFLTISCWLLMTCHVTIYCVKYYVGYLKLKQFSLKWFKYEARLSMSALAGYSDPYSWVIQLISGLVGNLTHWWLGSAGQVPIVQQIPRTGVGQVITHEYIQVYGYPWVFNDWVLHRSHRFGPMRVTWRVWYKACFSAQKTRLLCGVSNNCKYNNNESVYLVCQLPKMELESIKCGVEVI